jgi:hypothetical protein
MFRNKFTVTILNEDWNVLINTIKLKHIPRADELIYLTELSSYYKILTIVHNFENKNHGIFLIVTKYLD